MVDKINTSSNFEGYVRTILLSHAHKLLSRLRRHWSTVMSTVDCCSRPLQTCGLRTVQISIQLTTRSELSCSVVYRPTRRKSTPQLKQRLIKARCGLEHGDMAAVTFIFVLALVLQGNAATKLRRGGKFYSHLIRNWFLVTTLKELLKSANIYQNYSKNKSGLVFFDSQCSY